MFPCFLPLIILLWTYFIWWQISPVAIYMAPTTLSFSIASALSSLTVSQQALPSPATADVKMTRLFMLCCIIRKNISLPFLSYILSERQDQGRHPWSPKMVNIVSAMAWQHCQCLSSYSNFLSPFLQDWDVRSWAGDTLTDSLKPFPSGDQSFVLGSRMCLDALSVRTNPY